MKDPSAWRIDRLSLQGFKSFPERTTLDFPDPITGIIGPNGSGKSNLVEALRFVTGARAQELRGQELRAFLFHGAEGRAPQGIAEVRLELTRGQERIVVERRIEGDRSLFRVNGRPLSARALALHLSGTGLGRGGYAIVGQGEIGALLEAPEAALLAHLEEAAGLRPVAEAVRAAEERLREALALLEVREKALSELSAQRARLEEEAAQARQAAALELEALALRASLLLARKEEAATEMVQARNRLEALEAEEAALQGQRQTLEAERRALWEREEALRGRWAEVRLGLRERDGLAEELRSLTRVLRTLDRPPPAEPGPPVPPPPIPVEALRKRLERLRAEARRLEEERRRWEEARRRHEAEVARYEERLRAHQEALRERERLEEELREREAHLARLEAQGTERQQLEGVLAELQAQAQARGKEAERLRRLVEAGADLQEGPRRVRGLPGVLGVVADLLRPEPGLELALEAALGPRLQWVLTEDEAAAKAAIAKLKREGGRATFLPLPLLRPPALPLPPQARGLLGPAHRLARLTPPGLPQAVILGVLLGDTLIFQDLEAALAYRRTGGRERLVTLEGEVLERSGALSGGRTKGSGEAFLLRRRLEELEGEQAAQEAQARALAETLETLPKPEVLAEARAQVASLRHRLRLPPPPPPKPPLPPEATWDEGRMTQLEQERQALEEALVQAEAHERWRLLAEAWQEWRRAQEEADRVRARIAEIHVHLEATAPLAQEAETLEAQLREVQGAQRRLQEQEAQALARHNALLAERERLGLLLARREALVEELNRELSGLPLTSRVPGTPRTLQARLAQVERERSALGPVNALAERELAATEARHQTLEAEVAEATAALLRLEAEAKAVERSHGERLREAFARFQEAFQSNAWALLGARAEVRREGQGLRLLLVPAGKRTQDLRLLSLGEKTLGALAFLFALGELQGGLPLAVLDEVDAALDEANLLRFAQFLASGRQFILVTHQKRIMEACQTLYGVAAEGGVSRVYAIRKEAVHDL